MYLCEHPKLSIDTDVLMWLENKQNQDIKNLRSPCDNFYRCNLRKMMPVTFRHGSKNQSKSVKAIF